MSTLVGLQHMMQVLTRSEMWNTEGLKNTLSSYVKSCCFYKQILRHCFGVIRGCLWVGVLTAYRLVSFWLRKRFTLLALVCLFSLSSLLSISIYKYIYKNMFVCLLVCGVLMEIQTLAPILMKFCTHIPTCPRKVWPLPHPPWAWGTWNPISWRTHFLQNKRLQIYPGSAGYLS